MANLADATTEVDYVSDLSEGTAEEQNGGTRQAGSEEEPTDIRSLLTKSLEEAAPENAGRARNPDGTFAPKTSATPDTVTQAGAAQQPADPNAAPAQQQEYKPNLEAGEAEALKHVPKELQGNLIKAFQVREMAYYKADAVARELFQRARGYEEVEKMIAPRRERLAMLGATPEMELNQLYTLSDFAERDPAGFIQHFAAQRGIDLKQLSEDYIPLDPHIQQLQNEIAALKQGVGQSQQFQQSQVMGSVIDQVAQFADATDAAGNKLRPHFAAVERDLVPLIASIRASNPGAHPQQILNAAYEQAIWANPHTRQQLLDTETARRTQDAAAHAAKARNAGSSVSGAPSSGTTPRSTSEFGGSIRESLQAAFDRAR